MKILSLAHKISCQIASKVCVVLCRPSEAANWHNSDVLIAHYTCITVPNISWWTWRYTQRCKNSIRLDAYGMDLHIKDLVLMPWREGWKLLWDRWRATVCHYHYDKKTIHVTMTISYPPMIEETFAPGQPIVDRQGPLLPALDTNVMLCFSIRDRNCSIIFLVYQKKFFISVHYKIILTVW